MSFLRKASLSRKKGLNGDDGPRASSVRGEKPPRPRNVSEASTVAESGENGGNVKRKMSLGGKGRKRLSSLFSSSSLSSYVSDKDSGSSPKPKPYRNPSASSSGATTPTRYSGLNGKGTPPDIHKVNGGLADLRLGSEPSPVTDSPAPSSPSQTTAAGPPIQPVAAASPSKPPRPASMYSQWDLEEVAESSDDEDAFLSASEGLSEVAEEDEAETIETASKPPNHSEINRTLDATNVEKGAVAGQGNISGTGTSTIHRALPAVSETRVRQRATHHGDALRVDQAGVLAKDIDICREAIRLFLTSHMRDAEDLCFENDPENNHLYLQSSLSYLEALKGMMTFDSVDIATALEIAKATFVTATALRRPTQSIVSRLGGLVSSGQAVARVKSMTPLERHAELIYAETSLMKALLAIIGGGDWLGLVREALSLRAAHGIYRTLQHYLEDADKNGYDDDIDMDFRSGVLLGTGTSSLMLSLLPGKVLKIAEVFGYAGDRTVALNTLMSAGGWTQTSDQPQFDERNEGLRRPVCDLILLTFHLVISVLMPVAGVDIPMARKVLAYNMRRYPDGVFFLYFQARLHTTQAQPEAANRSLQKALDLKLEYIQLQHMCLWDYACNHLMLANWKGALDCFSILREESNWSRAVYTYAAAACIIELADDGDADAKISEADKLMQQIPKLTKKIAGKSLPIEKLVSRKARKFHSQKNRLFLPAMELAYVFGSLSNTPRRSLLDRLMPRVDAMLAKLDSTTPEQYGNGHEFWDDYCLGHFLRAMCQFTARYQPPEAAPEATARAPTDPPDDELDKGAERDFKAVIRHSPDVQLDHYILFHNHYELGRLYARRGDDEQAKHHFDIVMSSKLPEHNAYMAKAQGKYSLEGALMLKTHAAIQAIKEKEKSGK